MNNEFIGLLADLAIALSFIVGLIFGVAQVKAAARDRRERLTLETLRAFQTREFVDLMLFVLNQKMPTTQKELRALPVKDQAMYFQFSQEMESLGILVAEKLINLDLVDKTLGSSVVTTWNNYKPLFKDIRINQPDPFLGEYFQWLAERIDEQMKMFPRKPFYQTS